MDQNSNLHNRPSVQDISISVSEKEVKLEIKKNRTVRILYVIGGTASLVLAILGIIVPGLPVTPLALLSAFLYAKSSPRLYNWLLNNKILGPRIKNYQRRKGITRRGKVGVLAFMSIMVLFSSFIIVGPGTLRWVILALGLIGCIVVIFFVPNAKEN
ncbi:putative membrane protein [Proteiniphilum saccharofermentans]|uniref:Putative membrane protein n=1 Tax=Proteiniphilum saccharofermentans TaxID=1642647 RepID=A0A1R3SWJ2_9BACT|nr:YbaN family protein [Proteiniphilum saccharofermentans]SCD20656.1 putative membrane protein [Proteiniphilum saccharofermentans]